VDAATAAFLGEAIVLPADIDAGHARTPLGLLSIEDGAAKGRGTVLLRPEQLSVQRAEGSDANGTVADVAFGGSTCDTLVVLDGAEGHSFRLDIPNRDMLVVGDRIKVSVFGKAHVFG
jgi:iron(III) transport system ATP-binding protein